MALANTLSNHPSDHREAPPTVDAISPALGVPQATTLDNGYFDSETIAGLRARDILPSITTEREAHHLCWQRFSDDNPEAPADASPTLKMVPSGHAYSSNESWRRTFVNKSGYRRSFKSSKNSMNSSALLTAGSKWEPSANLAGFDTEPSGLFP